MNLSSWKGGKKGIIMASEERITGFIAVCKNLEGIDCGCHLWVSIDKGYESGAIALTLNLEDTIRLRDVLNKSIPHMQSYVDKNIL